MFELGPEKVMLVIVAVVIFLGPKELPAAIRTIREWHGRLRSLQDTIRAEIGTVLEHVGRVAGPGPGRGRG